MTTETQQGQQIDAAQVWRAIGHLEAQQEQTNERLKNIEDGLAHLSARVDRLFYLILGIGVATIASVWASNLLDG